MSILKAVILSLILGYNFSAYCQVSLQGKIVDLKSKSALSYVNIGIKGKNKHMGTAIPSFEDGIEFALSKAGEK